MVTAARLPAGPGAAEVESLLGRPEIRFDLAPALANLRGRRVLVTGAGGSIGSELCAAILTAGVERLVALDRAELGLYELDERFGRRHGDTEIFVSLADVAREAKMARLFGEHRPDVVFHTAAYKHVRYVEENPADGVVNNVAGTQTVVRLAQEAGAAQFVLISSDKAVEPTSVMGATKRLCERLIQQCSSTSTGASTGAYLAVRFGNVVRSRGSVIPKFEAQIAAGQPLTVHPEAERYFMSMDEAVGLVLSSTIVGRSGDICIQKMGAPVRIVDIARRLLEARGVAATPEAFRLVELLPGEKLREKLTSDAEEGGTRDQGHMLVCPAPDVRDAGLAAGMDELLRVAHEGKADRVRAALREVVADYEPAMGAL